jgi:hypothetical protein
VHVPKWAAAPAPEVQHMSQWGFCYATAVAVVCTSVAAVDLAEAQQGCEVVEHRRAIQPPCQPMKCCVQALARQLMFAPYQWCMLAADRGGAFKPEVPSGAACGVCGNFLEKMVSKQ